MSYKIEPLEPGDTEIQSAFVKVYRYGRKIGACINPQQVDRNSL